MRQLITFCLLLPVAFASAQVKTENLFGKWSACNKDSSFFKNNEIEFHQDINYQYKSNCCYFINWSIASKNSLCIENLFACTEPGRIIKLGKKESWRLTTESNVQIIKVFRDGKLIDKFQIVDYQEIKIDVYPFDTKVLKVKRVAITAKR